MRRHVVEIGRVARQAGQAQERQALALVEIVQPNAVLGPELRHQANSAIWVRLGSTWVGRDQSLSRGSSWRFTQAVMKP